MPIYKLFYNYSNIYTNQSLIEHAEKTTTPGQGQ